MMTEDGTYNPTPISGLYSFINNAGVSAGVKFQVGSDTYLLIGGYSSANRFLIRD